jgi:hypothetical protein
VWVPQTEGGFTLEFKTKETLKASDSNGQDIFIFIFILDLRKITLGFLGSSNEKNKVAVMCYHRLVNARRLSLI